MKAIVVAGLALCAAVLSAAPASAAVINVDCAKHDLRVKIDAAPPGSTLRVKGTCFGPIVLTKSLTLDGNPRATLDGGEGRPLTIAGTPTVRLLDLVVTGGSVGPGDSVAGGGISHSGGALTLRRVAVVDNKVVGRSYFGTPSATSQALGGGISSTGGSLALYDSSVSRNEALCSDGFCPAAEGGGIYRIGSLVLVRSSVNGNRARSIADETGEARGGGIALRDGTLRLRSSHVDGNRARGSVGGSGNAVARGGGISLNGAGSVLDVGASTLNGNLAIAFASGAFVGAQASGGAIDGVFNRAAITQTSMLGNAARARTAGGSSAFGGAIAVSAERVAIVRSTVLQSVVRAEGFLFDVTAGGAVRLVGSSGSTVEIDRSRIAGGVVTAATGDGSASAAGGGLQTVAGQLTVRTSTIDQNTVTASSNAASGASGGGISTSGTALIVTRSTISRNRASAASANAGGVSLPGPGSASFTNSTVAGNTTSGFGGAIALAGGVTLNLRSTTVARNRAATGGGIFSDAGTVTLRGTLLAANTAPSAPDCFGTIGSTGYNLVGKTAGCSFTHQASDRRNVGANLGVLGSYGGPTQTVSLRPGSRALNVIPKAGCGVATDQRGVRRPQERRCDIGSYERKP